MPAAAERALEITEFNDRDRSVCRTERVRALGGDIVTFVLRLLCGDGCFKHLDIALSRRLRGGGSASHSPGHIPREDAR